MYDSVIVIINFIIITCHELKDDSVNLKRILRWLEAKEDEVRVWLAPSSLKVERTWLTPSNLKEMR